MRKSNSRPARIRIRLLQGRAEARALAEMMAGSEPWVTLRRNAAKVFELLTDPAKEVYVAATDGALTGVIVVNMEGPFAGYIQAVAVMPAWRDCGIGSQLLEFAEQRIFRESPNVFLCVSRFNYRAQRFYRRLGYERVGELKNYVIRGANEILVRKTTGPKSEFMVKPRRKLRSSSR
jgi:[ribosomal protein S18]-alanine N-acetyltransferase